MNCLLSLVRQKPRRARVGSGSVGDPSGISLCPQLPWCRDGLGSWDVAPTPTPCAGVKWGVGEWTSVHAVLLCFNFGDESYPAFPRPEAHQVHARYKGRAARGGEAAGKGLCHGLPCRACLREGLEPGDLRVVCARTAGGGLVPCRRPEPASYFILDSGAGKRPKCRGGPTPPPRPRPSRATPAPYRGPGAGVAWTPWRVAWRGSGPHPDPPPSHPLSFFLLTSFPKWEIDHPTEGKKDRVIN